MLLGFGSDGRYNYGILRDYLFRIVYCEFCFIRFIKLKCCVFLVVINNRMEIVYNN